MNAPSAHGLEPKDWNLKRLKNLLSKAQRKTLVVVGDVGVDRYTIGRVERISPEAPVPIVHVEKETLKLGLSANVADNLQTLGGKALLLGVVGRDASGKDFKRILKNANIGSQKIIVDRERRTILKERVVSDRQQLLRIDYESPGVVSKSVKQKLFQHFLISLRSSDAVIIQDYAKGLMDLEFCQRLIKAANKARKPVIVDPNVRSRLDFFKGTFVLKPNTKQAESLSGIAIVDSVSLENAGRIILKNSGAQHVVVTLGKDGIALFSKGSKTMRIAPTYAREVFDVSGAGDTVIATLSLALAAGGAIEDAVILANFAASVVVGKLGTATVTQGELFQEMEAHLRVL